MDNSYITKNKFSSSPNKKISLFCIDLLIYLAVMFSVRELYFTQFNFITNGLFWSFTTLFVAGTLMHLRGVSWKDIGLCTPKNHQKFVLSIVFIFAFIIISILIFQMFIDLFTLSIAPDTSNEKAAAKFGDLSGNFELFFKIIPFIWLQSMLEEILDRGFLIYWIEKIFANTWLATVIAVLVQAIIFGFRHSYDLSERSITVGLIGLGMGIGYVCFGRNLWPLIIAHCLLNTMSMLDRV